MEKFNVISKHVDRRLQITGKIISVEDGPWHIFGVPHYPGEFQMTLGEADATPSTQVKCWQFEK